MINETIIVTPEGEDKKFYRVEVTTTQEVTNSISYSLVEIDDQIQQIDSQITELNGRKTELQAIRNKVSPKVDEKEAEILATPKEEVVAPAEEGIK